MFSQFYQNIILKNPRSIFLLLIIALLSFGYYSKDFKLDASSGVITASAINIGSRTVTELVGYATDGWVIDPNVNGISTTYSVGIATISASANHDLVIGTGLSFTGNAGNIYAVGIITASNGFIGTMRASDLTGTIDDARLPSTITSNITGDLTGTATTAQGLTGTPNISVGVLTATTLDIDSITVDYSTISNDFIVNGKVGIGTSAPTASLEIFNTTDISKLDIISTNNTSRISVGNSSNVSTGTSVALFEYESSDLSIKNKSPGDIKMYLHTGDLQSGITTGSYEWRYRAQSTPLAILTYEGNFGLGVASPSEKFHVSGASKFAGNVTLDSGYTFTINSTTFNINSTTLGISTDTTTTFFGAVNLNGAVSVAATVGFDTSYYAELKVPVYSNDSREGISTSIGSIIYNEDLQKLQFYDPVASTWRTVTST